MNKVRIILCCLAVLLLCLLAGCQLALADKGAEAGEDRLVGMLITTEHLDLFDMKSYLNENSGNISGGNVITDGNDGEYQGRLYATLKKKTQTNEETGETTQTDDYVFEGVKGMPYFCVRVPGAAQLDSYHATMGDDAIADCHTSINVKDLENSISLEGSIYISSNGSPSTYYLNPVYQSADGRVYVTTGTGVSFVNEQPEGAESTQTMTSSLSRTENGKTVKDSTFIKLIIHVMSPPQKIVVLQMDNASAIISRQEYAPESVPKAITPVLNTEYIVVESHKTDGEGKAQVTREIYGKDAQWLNTFRCREDGICVKQSTQLNWAK